MKWADLTLLQIPQAAEPFVRGGLLRQSLLQPTSIPLVSAQLAPVAAPSRGSDRRKLCHTLTERESTSLQGRRKYTREHGSPVIIPPTIHPSLASQLTANLRFHSLIYVLLTYAYLYELFTQKKIYELHIHVAQQTNSARWDRIDFASDAFLNELHSSCHHRVATANSCSQSQVTTINVQH